MSYGGAGYGSVPFSGEPLAVEPTTGLRRGIANLLSRLGKALALNRVQDPSPLPRQGTVTVNGRGAGVGVLGRQGSVERL